MTEKRNCGKCKHLSVIVSQTGDYWCCIKNKYYISSSDFISNCKDFKLDTLTLREKEEKVW